MANTLGLEWHLDRLTCVAGEADGGRARIHHAFEVPLSATQSGEDESSPGATLAAMLREKKIASRETIVTLPREDVVMRRLELPNVPDRELFEMLQLQLATVSATPMEELEFDYIAFPPRSADEPRQVLTASCTRQKLELIRNTLEQAGLTLERVSVSTLDLLNGLLGSGTLKASEQSALLVWHEQGRLEAIAYDLNGPHLIHAAELDEMDTPGDDRQLLAELSRTLVLYGQVLVNRPLTKIDLVGEFNESMVGELADRTRLNVTHLKSDSYSAGTNSETSGSTSSLPAALSMLANSSTGIPGFNFLEPRRPKPQPDRRKTYAMIAAIAACLAFAAIYSYVSIQHSDLETQIEKLNADIADVDTFLKRGQPILDSTKAVDAWDERSVDWLVELTRLGEQFPGTERVYFLDVRINPAGGDALAVIQGMGRAKTRQDVEWTYQRLSDAGYRVRPKQIDLTRNDPEYPYRFEIDLQLLEPASTKKTALLGGPVTPSANTGE
ncbi:type IV pilus biogenesis protein PilM [Calycomorphotria hydatis]|uniref:Competence protein A n=1 Tax=Calycomorphotria hydatis TaxID=2528027 RepID=A0A517T5I2_9PLAN|nr:hypothetical protein [Calycomorphotria hydatis]QDT63630.1 Competence protein A [Calycomorphotria hydatis]